MANKKFIPDGDSDFARMARSFAVLIQKNPDRYCVSTDEAAEISEAVQAPHLRSFTTTPMRVKHLVPAASGGADGTGVLGAVGGCFQLCAVNFYP